jgi:hypothetical protein
MSNLRYMSNECYIRMLDVDLKQYRFQYWHERFIEERIEITHVN